MKSIPLSVMLLIGATISAIAQSPTPSQLSGSHELFETIARMDAKFFEAFNAHNLDGMMEMFADDLEFYQDNDGVSNYQQSKDDFTKMLASVPDIRRELVKESLEVYPIKDYGAIEIGIHRFCHKEHGKEECGSFKFVHVWRKTGDSWKISRIISYGH
jgi:ketosteroid isomerase-like protein